MSNVVNSHRVSQVWQKGMEPAQQCYQLTESIPDSEKFGLVSLVRRAAVSFPPNIAEGNGRGTTGEFIQFLRIAQGSWKELETQLILSQGLGFIAAGTEHATLSNTENLGKMMRSLIRRVCDKKARNRS